MMPDHQEWAASEGPHRLPPPLDGWFPVAYSIDTDRHLARMCATVDVRGKWAAWRKDFASGSLQSPGPFIADDTRGRIEVFAGSDLIEAFEFLLETPFPKFDRLPDGRWVVTDARCRPGETNARILGTDGTVLSRISLGDAIEDLQCDHMGGIWVSYFDERIGDSGASEEQGESPGASGVNRLRVDGTISWSPGPDFYPPIYDCYAMNVGTDGVWLCYYDDFPIMHVPFNGVVRQWRNDAVRGAELVAADGNLAVLLGGYQDEAGTGAVLRLGDDGHAEVLHRFRLDAALYSAMCAGFAIARGSEIHFIVNNVWHVISVGDFVAGLAQTPPLYAPNVPPPVEDEPAGPGWRLKDYAKDYSRNARIAARSLEVRHAKDEISR
jgi:hypothetical protein